MTTVSGVSDAMSSTVEVPEGWVDILFEWRRVGAKGLAKLWINDDGYVSIPAATNLVVDAVRWFEVGSTFAEGTIGGSLLVDDIEVWRD